jgi:hypothetical protein
MLQKSLQLKIHVTEEVVSLQKIHGYHANGAEGFRRGDLWVPSGTSIFFMEERDYGFGCQLWSLENLGSSRLVFLKCIRRGVK